MSRDQLLQAALALTPAERTAFAAKLLESLDEPADEDSDAAWDAEIARRLAELDRGEAVTTAADEVFARARKL